MSGKRVEFATTRGGPYRYTYESFRAARRRCTDPKYLYFRYYGERGIKFLFSSFKNFIDAMGVRPYGFILDRIDNNGNYEPGNCRWATVAENNKNKRASNGYPINRDWRRFISEC